jgi:hypothetical protein
MENGGALSGHSEYFTAIWYFVWSFGIFFSVLEEKYVKIAIFGDIYTKKNLSMFK